MEFALADNREKQTLAKKPLRPSRNFAANESLVNFAIVREKVAALVEECGDATSAKCRMALMLLLKDIITEGDALAQERLLEDGSGLKCATRLSNFQDELIGIIYNFAVEHVYRVDNPSSGERMAVIAVGGYGRGTLAPGSDIDLLFLLPYKQTPWGESVVEFILYMLWDLNFKVGNATRNVDVCIRLSKQDITIRTAILEARFLWGDTALFDDLEARFDKEIVSGTGAEFIEAKMIERDQRHAKAGGTRYLVEPNVKEGKGGLRDLHTLFWVSKYFYRVKTDKELVEVGVFDKSEYKLFKKSGDFLWAVRCHLHYMTGRAEERLSFELQREMASRLNYKTHAGLLDVERFMKHYFLVAKNIGDLTMILSAKLEEEQVKSTPAFSRLMAVVRRRRPSTIKGSDAFVLENNRIRQIDNAIFKDDPVNLLRAFKVADETGHNFHPDLMYLIARSLKLIDKTLRSHEEANQIFLKILSSPRDPETAIRKMNESGVLGRFVPDFGKVIAMMQFNMYHHYTVDEHTIRAIGMLALIERGELAEDHPLANDVIDTINDRMVLYVTLFLHDIAKGRPEDHSIAGAKVAKRLGKRFNLKPAQIETISWLVREHLTMSMIAQSRDLSDPQTIRDFANIVQTPERLKLLLILTICDIRAVGPEVWNGWKGQLLRTLYYETQPLLTGGYNVLAIDERSKHARNTLAVALSDWSPEDRDAYVAQHYPAYLLRTDLDVQISHANFIKASCNEENPVATMARSLAFEGVTEVTVYAADQANMLTLLAGACARAGAHIVGAQIFTTRDNFALHMVNVRREFNDDEDEFRRAERICDEITFALSDVVKPDEANFSLKAVRRSTKAFSVIPDIVIDNTLSNRFSVIETSGKDRGGLLRDLAMAIFDLNLTISSAHIATFGERAVDVFYVTDHTGGKIESKTRQTKIKHRLERAFALPSKTASKAA